MEEIQCGGDLIINGSQYKNIRDTRWQVAKQVVIKEVSLRIGEIQGVRDLI